MGDMKEKLLNKSRDQIEKIRAWEIKKQIVTFTVLSTVNFISLFHIILLSKSILEHIGAYEYFVFTSGLIGLANFVGDILNVYYMIFIKHNVRIYIASILTSISIGLIIISQEKKNFILYNIAIFFLSCFTNMTGTTLVGLAKVFSLGVSKGIAVGISLGGLTSSLIILILGYLEIDYIYELILVFFLCIPQFFLIHKIYVLKVAEEHIRDHIDTLDDLDAVEEVDEDEIEQIEERETKINVTLGRSNFCSIFGLMKSYMINYILMVILTAILQSLGAKMSSNLFKDSKKYIDEKMFEIQQTIINVGVLVGKLIVGLRVETHLFIITFLLFVSFVLFFGLCYVEFKWNLAYFFIQFVSSVLRGIMFSSVICLIMIDDKIERREKELCQMLRSFSFGFSQFVASILARILEKALDVN